MYKLLHIVLGFLILAVVSVSCTKTTDEPVAPVLAELEVIIPSVVGDEGNREVVKRVRFIVFKNMTTDARLDVNEYTETTSSIAVTNFSAKLKATVSDNSMVIVIVNEPTAMKNVLDAISGTRDAENMIFNIADIMNAAGAISDMPMIGVKRDIAVVAEPGPTDNKVKMVVERAVARVDIYLEAMPGSVSTGYTENSSVMLHNVSYQSYFAMGNVDNGTRDNTTETWKNYGKVMQNVAVQDVPKTWPTGTDETWFYIPGNAANNRQMLASFYVAERLFTTDFPGDRLAVSMANIKRANLLTGTTERVVIDKITPKEGGNEEDFNEIRRNNVYEITARVGAVSEITFVSVSVEAWVPLNVDIPIN